MYINKHVAQNCTCHVVKAYIFKQYIALFLSIYILLLLLLLRLERSVNEGNHKRARSIISHKITHIFFIPFSRGGNCFRKQE